MTQAQPLQCDTCGERVTIAKESYGDRLVATCGCDTTRSIKISAIPPEAWSV